MKTNYKIQATSFRKGTDQILDRSFCVFTHAWSVKQAVLQIKKKYPDLTLRDVRVEAVEEAPKEVMQWEQLSLL